MGLSLRHVVQAWAALEGKKGDCALADQLFEAADRLEPGNPVLLSAWADFRRRRQGDCAGARHIYEDALSANPDDVRSLQVLQSAPSKTYKERSQITEGRRDNCARQSYEDALHAKPTDVRSL